VSGDAIRVVTATNTFHDYRQLRAATQPIEIVEAEVGFEIVTNIRRETGSFDIWNTPLPERREIFHGQTRWQCELVSRIALACAETRRIYGKDDRLRPGGLGALDASANTVSIAVFESELRINRVPADLAAWAAAISPAAQASL